METFEAVSDHEAADIPGTERLDHVDVYNAF